MVSAPFSGVRVSLGMRVEVLRLSDGDRSPVQHRATVKAAASLVLRYIKVFIYTYNTHTYIKNLYPDALVRVAA